MCFKDPSLLSYALSMEKGVKHFVRQETSDTITVPMPPHSINTSRRVPMWTVYNLHTIRAAGEKSFLVQAIGLCLGIQVADLYYPISDVYSHWSSFPVLFPRLNNASSYNSSFYVRCSNPLIIFMFFCRCSLVHPHTSCLVEPRTEPSSPNVSHQCWVEGNTHLPQPSVSAAQDVVGLLCCKDTLLVHHLLTTGFFSAKLIFR